MTNTNRTLVDWLDDLCVRFIVNLPNEELQSVERICFQIEEAQWFYEDFIRPLDPNNLPSMHLRKFSQLMFQHCPLFSAYSEELHQQAYEQFLAYKTRVPVRGAIMLNEDMTHAVLVKGWKKGAKWSFPRGKINKEETDLDCAVREVWEETGYDLREADLVEPDEHMKKITVTMREQSMMLYVFRGVPMDTYFEPRTRKEISKIDWYKLTDLPTLRRKNQVQQQQGNGNDLIKESNFYMVAPFLGPLRQWIKQQHRLGRQRQRNSAHVAPAPVPGTDDEDIQNTLYETTVNQAAPVADAQVADNFAEMVARLGRGHRPSDSFPEVSNEHQAPQQSQDPAEALKRLLSVGMQSPPVEAPSQPPPQGNPLLALFKQGNNQHAGNQQPRTPFEQMMPPPMQPSSPHGQHGPRPPQMGNMGPPPPFFSPHQGMPFRGHPGHMNGMQPPPPHMSPHFMHQQPQQQQSMFPPQPPNMQQAFDQHNLRPQFQEMGDSQFAGGNGRPAIPSASNLPAPNLNAHALGLLNSFKNENQQPAFPPSPQTTIAAPLHRSSQTTPRIQHPLPQHRPHGLVSPQAQFVPSPPQFQSPPISSSFEPEQPKPRNAHQDSLLNLFRPTPPLASPDTAPAELSALPTTPGYVSAQPVADPSRQPNAALLAVFNAPPNKTNMTSATVSGPVNAPDFDTMKKNRQPTNSSSRGPSPATNMPFMPQQILKRAPQASPQPAPPAEVSGSPRIAFQPQILKRPQQQSKAPGPAGTGEKTTPHAQGLLDMFKGPSPKPPPTLPAVLPSRSPVPPPISGMDRRESVPSEQKNALLSLFGNKPSPSPKPQMQSPVPPARSPLPPTPKTSMSGLVSPVSPLPANGSVSATSPEGMANRSRISSIGDGKAPSIVIPPISHPADAGISLEQNEGVSLAGLGASQARAGSASGGKSPVDKSFLLGFLEDVARRGR